MKSHSEVRIFSRQEMESYHRAVVAVSQLPDIPNLRCHEVARAVGMTLHLPIQDGHYGLIEHSWIWTKPWKWGTYPSNVLDVYCVGRLPQVQLIDLQYLLPHMPMYKPSKPRTDIDHALVLELQRHLRWSDSMINASH